MEKTYSEDIYEIAMETFEMMCYMFPLDESEIEPGQEEAIEEGVIAFARFDGASEGALAIQPAPELLEAIALNMLGTDEAGLQEKEGALCEMVNIVCGNVAPFFSKDDQICIIRPPKIAGEEENTDELFKGMNKEEILIHLDEGSARIIVYYS
ncbi:chemotaxis protein CheX [Balneolaceae bacterium ANBcel3]|nr:chemotaxis protein CheX [Balneolaceae bacterium ANBcel3]